jgi:hypothetical protein
MLTPPFSPRFRSMGFFGSPRIARPALPSPLERFAPSPVRPSYFGTRGAFRLAGIPLGMYYLRIPTPPPFNPIFLPLVYRTFQGILTPPISQNFDQKPVNLATSANCSPPSKFTHFAPPSNSCISRMSFYLGRPGTFLPFYLGSREDCTNQLPSANGPPREWSGPFIVICGSSIPSVLHIMERATPLTVV